MTLKHLLLLIAGVIASGVVWARVFPGRELPKVDSELKTQAVDFTRELIGYAQNKQGRDFLKKMADPRDRNAPEYFHTLKNSTPHADSPKWKVSQDANGMLYISYINHHNRNILVFCCRHNNELRLCGTTLH